MNWKKIKQEAKEKCNGKLWDIWKPILIISFISMIIGLIAGRIFGAESTSGNIVNSIFTLLLVPAEVGLISYILKLVRGEDYDLSELKVYYDKIGVLILINILVGLLTVLGCILLIIPGFIIALALTMVFYIFVDNDSLTASEYLQRSKEMMNGYKWNYFCFCLSFIGWILLCVLVVPVIWVVPYVTTAQALYYEELKNVKSE